ncbi:MAG: MFS transporter [Paenibacillaceae bacterium]|nr:MFS transporter [Paenibacillaceae bacterium]
MRWRELLQPATLSSGGNALFYNAFAALTTGIFLNDYLLRLGFTPFDFGVMYALLSITGFVAFPFSFYAGSIEWKKTFFLAFHFAALGCFLLFVCAPYMPGLGTRGMIWLSIVSLGLFSIISGIGRLVLVPWLFSVVGNASWYSFYLVRMVISYSVPVAALLLFRGMLDHGGVGVMSMLFFIALAMGTLGVVAMMLFPPSVREEGGEQRDRLGDIVRTMLGNRGFLATIVFGILLAFATGLFAPAAFPYLIKEVGIASSTVSLYQIVMTAASVLSVFLITHISRRYGSVSALLRLSCIMWAVPALLLAVKLSAVVVTPFLFALGVMDGYGLVFAGMYVTVMNILLQLAPPRNRVVYLASFEFVKAIFMSLGSFVSGLIADRPGTFAFGGVSLGPYELIFALSLAFMAAALLVAVLGRKAMLGEASAEAAPQAAGQRGAVSKQARK